MIPTKSQWLAVLFAGATTLVTATASADPPPSWRSYPPAPPVSYLPTPPYAPAPAFAMPPAADREDDGPNGLLIGGLSALAALHAAATASAIAIGADGYEHTGYAAIPLFGPFIAAATTRTDERLMDLSRVYGLGFLANGAGQAVASTLLILGLAGVGDDEPDTASGTVRVSPSAAGAEAGIGLSGSF